MVHRRAHLAGVEALDVQDALGRGAQRKVVAHDGGRLAAELQRHRAQVARRRRHHRAAGAAGAGEQQVVEGQLRERDAHAAAVVEDAQLVGREVVRQRGHQQLGEMARVLAHLHHRAVAGGKDGHQRQEAQVDREVPGHDHPDHAQGLRDHAVGGQAEDLAVDGALLRLHPAAQVLERDLDVADHRHQLHQHRLVARAVAVVGADGVADRFLVVEDVAAQLQQVGLALGQRGQRMGQMRLALQAQRSIQGTGQACFARLTRSGGVVRHLASVNQNLPPGLESCA